MTTAAERRHLDRIASFPCAVCGDEPVHVHHLREGQGMAQRSSNWLTVPLCHECHQGKEGIHGDKSIMRVMKLTELDLLARTIERISG